jgi:DNA-binding NarL/FixJ family response regulator
MDLNNGFSTPAARPKLLFADDHHIVLDALALMAQPHFEVRTADTLSGFEEAVDGFSPDLAILDVRMPDGDGFEVARRVLEKRPSLKIMFLSMHTETRFMKRAMEVGARAYLSKRGRMNELLSAIHTVLNGGTYVSEGLPHEQGAPSTDSGLTGRQVEVLRLISRGCPAREIASCLGISVRTAEFHRAAIMGRLKLHSTAMMTRYAMERGLS